MQHTTRSLLVAFGSAAVLVAAPLALDLQERTVADDAVTVPSQAPASPTDAAPTVAVPAAVPAVPVLPATADDPSAGGGPAEHTAAPDPAPTAPAPLPAGATRGGDLPPELLPVPPYPQCPITEDGAWWTDPADPYTCLRPGSVTFYEPTPPGIPPELLEPIFEEPDAAPTPENDCRTSGALRCTVTIMGQEYVVTFREGKPVSVLEAQG
ncbi:hypothetical protein [Arthrobacter sp. TMS1-12-1]